MVLIIFWTLQILLLLYLSFLKSVKLKIMKTIVLCIFGYMYHNYGGSKILFINSQAYSKLTKNKILIHFSVGSYTC